MAKKFPRSAWVLRKEWLHPRFLRIVLGGVLVGEIGPLEFTDSYIKVLIPGEDPTAPILRTYTVRRLRGDAEELALDVWLHDGNSPGNDWARAVQPGTEVVFFGPGGKWHPTSLPQQILAGDEVALPAISAALKSMPREAQGHALVEIAEPGLELDLPVPDGFQVTWVYRQAQTVGIPLVAAVRQLVTPNERTGFFIHGVAEMVRDLRKWLFVDHNVPRASVSASGYWRLGMTAEEWRASKKEFVAAMDRVEGAVGNA